MDPVAHLAAPTTRSRRVSGSHNPGIDPAAHPDNETSLFPRRYELLDTVRRVSLIVSLTLDGTPVGNMDLDLGRN